MQERMRHAGSCILRGTCLTHAFILHHASFMAQMQTTGNIVLQRDCIHGKHLLVIHTYGLLLNRTHAAAPTS